MPSTYLTREGKQSLEVSAAYSWLGDKFRQAASHDLICSLGCGGLKCKFCVPEERFRPEDYVVAGVYSNWVEPHFVAISRPSTPAMIKYRIVEQFTKKGIKSIINLQTPGEHSKCGHPLEQSGFSYKPEDFMNQGIFFYNYAWPDFGTPDIEELLDAVQVVDFSVEQGKVAVHCHAGKGRTGSLIACYFVYVHRVPASAAILYVRQSREGSIQTKGQVLLVKTFETFLEPYWVIFPGVDPNCKPRSLQVAIEMQNKIMHGQERKLLRNMPKVVFVACQLLKKLADLKSQSGEDGMKDESGSEFPPELKQIIDLYFEKRQTIWEKNSKAEVGNQLRNSNARKMIEKGGRIGDDRTDVSSNKATDLDSPHSSQRGLSNLSDSDKDEDMRLDDEQEKSHEFVYPVEKVMNADSDRKMRSLRNRRDSNASIGSYSMIPTSSKSFSINPFDTTDESNALSGSTTSPPVGQKIAVHDNTSGNSSLVDCVLCDDATVMQFVRSLEEEVNVAPSCWDLLMRQTDARVIALLLWDWFDQLEFPALSSPDLESLINTNITSFLSGESGTQIDTSQLQQMLRKALRAEKADTLFIVLRTMAELSSNLEEYKVLANRALTAFTHASASVPISSSRSPTRNLTLWSNCISLISSFYKSFSKTENVSIDKTDQLTPASSIDEDHEDLFNTR